MHRRRSPFNECWRHFRQYFINQQICSAVSRDLRLFTTLAFPYSFAGCFFVSVLNSLLPVQTLPPIIVGAAGGTLNTALQIVASSQRYTVSSIQGDLIALIHDD